MIEFPFANCKDELETPDWTKELLQEKYNI